MTCHWETPFTTTASTFTPTQSLTHIHMYNSHTITTVLFNPHDDSRSRRTILKLQLPGGENEARGGGVRGEGDEFRRRQAGDRAPTLLTRTQAGGQRAMDATCQALH